ncbi:hypothetical protein BJV77DRAFT_286169 [Russula vinacea]|nr:hypothetical protein BJV77DRAFT_286169 [Russula vinacea]
MIELGGTVLNEQSRMRCAEVGRSYRMSGFGGQGDMGVLLPWLNHSLSSRPPRPGQPPNVFFFLLFHKTSYPRDSSISWCPGFFGNSSRYLPGSFPNLFLFLFVSLVDLQDAGKVSAFVESDRGSTMNRLSAIEREGDLCRNYTCCGFNLQDFHAVVEHFEEFHVVINPCSQLVFGQPYPHNYPAPSASPTHDSYIPHSAQVPRLQPQMA